jgi:hypothetical protein
MKKASRIVGLLLPLVMAVVVLGCPTGDGGETQDTYQNPKALTTEWQTFYIKNVDPARTDAPDLTGIERWHFHNNTYDGPIGIEIQKIFVSSTKSAGVPKGATMVVDYTLDAPDVNVYDPAFTESGIWTKTSGADGKATTGTRNDTDYKYLGNIGTSVGASTVYWGFVMRNVSATAKADSINMQCTGATMTTGNNNKILRIAQWFGLDSASDFEEDEEEEDEPVVVGNWTPVYYDYSALDGPGIIALHLDNGSNPAEIRIQKIFLSDAKSEAGAKVLVDFTQTSSFNNDDFWWGADSFGTITNNEYVLATTDGTYVAGARFAPKDLGTYKYIGFIIKSATGLGDARFQPQKDEGGSAVDLATVRFDSLLSEEPEIDLSNWTPAYLHLTGDLDTAVNHFFFHVNTGIVEIQKVLVNTAKSMDGAITVLDFTRSDGTNSSFPHLITGYNYGIDGALITEGGTANGRYSLAGTGDYIYGGDFASGAAYDNSATYWIFVIKTAGSGLGDVRLEPAKSDDKLPIVRFDALEF